MLNLFFVDFKIGHYLWARKVVRKFVAGERQTTQNDPIGSSLQLTFALLSVH